MTTDTTTTGRTFAIVCPTCKAVDTLEMIYREERVYTIVAMPSPSNNNRGTYHLQSKAQKSKAQHQACKTCSYTSVQHPDPKQIVREVSNGATGC